MNDQPSEKKDGEEGEILKTFDMYRCFSRVDVILAILFIVGLLLLILFYIWPTYIA